MKTKHVVIGLAATVVAALAVYLLIAAHGRATDVSLARLRFELGERHSYRVEWTVTTGAAISPAQARGLPQQLDFASKLTGTVDVETLGVAPGEATLGVVLSDVEDFSFQMHGNDAVKDRDATIASLRGKRAFVTMTTRGEVKAIAFDEGTAAGTRNALRGLVMQMQLSLPAEASERWSADEVVAVGRMRFGYTGNATRIQRSPRALVAVDAAPGPVEGVQSVRGGATFALAAGQLEEIADQETWSYTRKGATTPAVSHDSVFRLRRIRTTRFDSTAIQRPRLPGKPLAETVEDPDVERRLEMALAREMTREKLIASVEHFQAGQKADHEVVAHAAAFVRLNPEMAAELAKEFVRKDFTARGRGMILDILAAAGDANAQAKMRDLLRTREAHETSSRFGVLVQRFSFVKQPTAETATFLEKLLRDARTTDLAAAQGAAVALGAVANHMARGGDTRHARAATALLAEELAGAREPEHIRALVAGLGNSGDATHVELLRTFSIHDDPRVRAEVAGAFGAIRSDAARGGLIELAADRDGAVGALAFSSLGAHDLGDADWAKLADLAKQGRTSPTSDGGFVDLVRRQRDTAGTHGVEILQSLQLRNTGPDNDLSQVIGQLLAQK